MFAMIDIVEKLIIEHFRLRLNAISQPRTSHGVASIPRVQQHMLASLVRWLNARLHLKVTWEYISLHIAIIMDETAS